MPKLIIAPDYTEIDASLIFLAGPIQGAERWQDKAVQIIQEIAPECQIANPRRPGDIKGDFPHEEYLKQVDWETFHLRKAGEKGAIIFWLAKESVHLCDRAYAQTTRIELGEWKLRHERDNAKLVLGIEEGFSNAKYIRRRFSQDCPEIKICSTLKETCEEAVKLAKK